MNKQEQLAEQIAKKHLGILWNELGAGAKQLMLAAIVEAMGVQQDESQSADIKELKAWMNRLRSSNVQLFTKDVASGANVIVDEVIGWCNRKMQQGSSASAPAKEVEAMPDESINKEWSESSPVHAIILNEHIAYEVLWKCKKGHTNFQTILNKEGLQHDICLKCGKHYVYTVAKTLSVEAMGVQQESDYVGKSATQVLKEHGINIMELNDDFNAQLFHAMERYAEQRVIPQQSVFAPAKEAISVPAQSTTQILSDFLIKGAKLEAFEITDKQKEELQIVMEQFDIEARRRAALALMDLSKMYFTAQPLQPSLEEKKEEDRV
jgi:hypothetical protein